jgi:formamidopyrimidine-DNA glycosylase
MPELPEVETVRTELDRLLAHQRIIRWERRRADLRTPIPAKLPIGPVHGVRRRAKYLLLAVGDGTVLNHLGMTGVWAERTTIQPHDHVRVHLADGRVLVFNDPRRFGLLELCRPDGGHAALDHLGPEPLSPAFTPDRLAGRRAPIKTVIMDQRVVVGVGNIYASESLLRAGIRPMRRRLTAAERERLATCIRSVLTEAIQAGGSSIDDFRHVNGLSGRFQQTLLVYNRTQCGRCGGRVRQTTIGGRSSWWCPACQR